MRHFGIFLDADGVLWPEIGQSSLLSGEEFAIDRLTSLKKTLMPNKNYFISVVTNQTLAARGVLDFTDFKSAVDSLFHKLIKLELINAFRVCFHHPNAKYLPLREMNCECRKPNAGMILDILSTYGIKPYDSLMIGDRITDISAAEKARLTRGIIIYNEEMFTMNQGKKGDSVVEACLEFEVARDLEEAGTLINKRFSYHD